MATDLLTYGLGFAPYRLLTVGLGTGTGPAPLAPGAVFPVATSPTSANVNGTPVTGGVAPFTYQFYRAPDAGGEPGTFAPVGSPRGPLGAGVAPQTLVDTGLIESTRYWYQYTAADSGTPSPTSVTTLAVSITTPAAPIITPVPPTSVYWSTGVRLGIDPDQSSGKAV